VSPLSLSRPVPLFKHFCPLCPLRLLHGGPHTDGVAAVYQALRRVRLETRPSAAPCGVIQTVRLRSATIHRFPNPGRNARRIRMGEPCWGYVHPLGDVYRKPGRPLPNMGVTCTENDGDIYRKKGGHLPKITFHNLLILCVLDDYWPSGIFLIGFQRYSPIGPRGLMCGNAHHR
jgi:hypothetical protein